MENRVCIIFILDYTSELFSLLIGFRMEMN